MIKTNRLRTIALIVGGVLVLGLTGCGNTFRGAGQDMEILGRRMQGSNTAYPQDSGGGYYR